MTDVGKGSYGERAREREDNATSEQASSDESSRCVGCDDRSSWLLE